MVLLTGAVVAPVGAVLLVTVGVTETAGWAH